MGLWKRREERLYDALAEDRKANIEVVFSAFESVATPKAYLTMPVTTGRRFYDVLDRYGARTVDDLERIRPGALREEIILPNIEEAGRFATSIDASVPLVVPGIFEARRQRWSQDEYMILWLRLITDSVTELRLCEDWEYSNGGAIEFCRAMMIRFRFIEERAAPIDVFDHRGEPIDLNQGIRLLTAAVRDLSGRGFDTAKLRIELAQLVGMAAYLNDPLTTRSEWSRRTDGRPVDMAAALQAAASVGLNVRFDPAF